MLRDPFTEPLTLYSGVPSTAAAEIPADAEYFNAEVGRAISGRVLAAYEQEHNALPANVTPIQTDLTTQRLRSEAAAESGYVVRCTIPSESFATRFAKPT
jgi:hypothetical protein